MTIFRARAFRDVVRDFLNYVKARTGVLRIDENSGSVVRSIGEAFALEIDQAYAMMVRLSRAGDIDYLYKEDLDHEMAKWGLTRRLKTYATTPVTFSRSTYSTVQTVSVGTLVEVPRTSLEAPIQFETSELGTFAIAPSGTDGITLISDTLFTAASAPFLPGHVGKTLYIRSGADAGDHIIKSYISATQVRVDSNFAASVGSLGFDVIEDNVRDVTVNAICTSGGLVGNVVAGAITRIVNKISGVDSVTNANDATPGWPDESDQEARTRLKQHIAGLAKCTISAIEAAVIGAEVNNRVIRSAKLLESYTVIPPFKTPRHILYIDDGTSSPKESEPVGIPYVSPWPFTTGSSTAASDVFADATNQPFLSTMANEYLAIETGADAGMYQILAYIDDTNVQLSGALGATAPGLTYRCMGKKAYTAAGGEKQVYLPNYPIARATGQHTLAIYNPGNPWAPGVYGTPGANPARLVEGTDYDINPANGQVLLQDALVLDDEVYAAYTYYTGIIAEAQKIVDGDPTDRTTYPGYRAGGVLVLADTAVGVHTIDVSCKTVVKPGYSKASVDSKVRAAIINYINSLGFGPEFENRVLFVTTLIDVIKAVPGILDVTIYLPTANYTPADGWLVRTDSSHVQVV